MDPLHAAALRWALGDQSSELLPELATDALVRGFDTPALRELAGIAPGDFWRIGPLFEQALEELGLKSPDEQTALWLLAKHIAAEVVAGVIPPSVGAHRIWSEISHRIVREGDLRVFIGLASEWDDHPSDRPAVEASILEAARLLVDQAEPRRWVRAQARHRTSPLSDSGTGEEIRPDDLPITQALSCALIDWAADYDATFTEPAGFVTEEDAVTFVERGRELVEGIQRELGDQWCVEYLPEPTRPPGLRLRGST